MKALVYMLQRLDASSQTFCDPYPTTRTLAFLPGVDWWGWDAMTGKPTAAVRQHCEREVERPRGALEEEKLQKAIQESWNATRAEVKP